MKNEIIKDDYQVVAHCGNYEPYAAGYRDGIAIGENKAMAKLEKIEKGQKDFEELELKMHKYFQTINLSDKHTELEKLALDIVCDGMQTLGCLNGILRGENE